LLKMNDFLDYFQGLQKIVGVGHFAVIGVAQWKSALDTFTLEAERRQNSNET